jgi:hypothetical protein
MPPGWLAGCRTSSKATGKHMHEIAEKAPWQQFENKHSASSNKTKKLTW